MQLKFNFQEKEQTSTFAGDFTQAEVEYLLQYAVQSLLQKGLMVVQAASEEETCH